MRIDDLIKRSDALACFHDWVDEHGYIHEADEMTEYQAIEALPSALPQWIPYPENEPEKGKYLVTARYNGNLIVDIDDYYSYGWDDWGDAVVAWAEMPEPYKEES